MDEPHVEVEADTNPFATLVAVAGKGKLGGHVHSAGDHLYGNFDSGRSRKDGSIGVGDEIRRERTHHGVSRVIRFILGIDIRDK
ncbi:MAG: hypothetical protein ACLQHW_13755 [bacterium]